MLFVILLSARPGTTLQEGGSQTAVAVSGGLECHR